MAMKPLPLYKNIRRKLLESLAQGKWMPGDRLPTEPELAKQFGVSISTVRAALSELVEASIITRHQGKGTIVAFHDINRSRYHFSHLHDKLGNKALTTRKLLHIKKAIPNTETTKELQLLEREPNDIYEVSATLNVNKKSIAVMTVLLPAWLFPKFNNSGLNQTEENLYAIFQRLYGVTVVRMDEKVYAAKANRYQAKLLGISINDPVLQVDRVSYTYDDIPVEIRKRTFHSSYQYLYKQERVE